jgi:REP element-mobilizing transposase RayT
MNTWNLWAPSFYAGTIGDVTTAEVKAYLEDNRATTL